MRKNALFGSSSALLLAVAATLSLPTTAAAQQKVPELTEEEVIGICTAVGEIEGSSFEECIAEATTGNAAMACEFLIRRGVLPETRGGIDLNQGRCVSTLRHYQNDVRKAGE